jgi:regulator of protease activity HflC (stomatin/prohibitin superfamily)
VKVLIIVLVIVAVLVLIGLAMALKIVKQYEKGVLFRLGRVRGLRNPGLRVIIPFIDVLHRVSLRIVTMPIQSQGIITRDNVSVDVSAVAYFRVTDAVRSVVAIENVRAALCAWRGLRHDDGPSAGTAAAEPAEPGRARR